MCRFAIAATIMLLAGCVATVTVDKRPNIALPIYSESHPTNNPVNYVVVDQGYEVKYKKWGFSTEIDSMSAEVTTNKTVNFHLGGLHSTAPTNSISIKMQDLLHIANLLRDSNATTNIVDVVD